MLTELAKNSAFTRWLIVLYTLSQGVIINLFHSCPFQYIVVLSFIWIPWDWTTSLKPLTFYLRHMVLEPGFALANGRL